MQKNVMHTHDSQIKNIIAQHAIIFFIVLFIFFYYFSFTFHCFFIMYNYK